MSEEKPHLSDSLIPRLQQTLTTCSQLIEAGDFSNSDGLLTGLADFLTPISEEASNLDLETTSFQILTEIHCFISAPSRNQEVIDALSFELPKVVCKFACASKSCSEIAELIVGHLVSMCSPREMLSILCEALSSPTEMFRVPCYFSPLIGGLAKVIILIKRRQFEQVKAAVPVILGVLKSMSLEADEEGKDTEDLFHKAIALADSIQAVCKLLEQKDKKKLCALLGMFVLQVMALVSIAMGHNISSLLPIMIHLSHFLPICGLSYEGLITGLDVDKFTTICGDDGDDNMACFSHVKHGGSLAVIWGYKSNETSVAADTDFEAVKNELQKNQTKRWQAIGMLKYVFSSVDLSWELKVHALDFLLCIMDGCMHQEIQNDTMDYSTYVPTLYTSLQAIEMVIIYAPNAVLRKKSFDTLMKVLADVPSSLRFDILTALIQNSESSSMIAILLDCIRREMHEEYSSCISVNSGVSEAEVKYSQCLSFWSAGVLELVELVLKPPNGGPPSLPEYSDALIDNRIWGTNNQFIEDFIHRIIPLLIYIDVVLNIFGDLHLMTIFDQLSLSLSIEVMLLQYTSSNLQRNEKHSSLNQRFLPAFFINFMTCIKSGSHTIVNLCFLMEHFLRSTTRMLLGFEAQSKVVYFCSKMNNWAY